MTVSLQGVCRFLSIFVFVCTGMTVPVPNTLSSTPAQSRMRFPSERRAAGHTLYPRPMVSPKSTRTAAIPNARSLSASAAESPLATLMSPLNATVPLRSLALGNHTQVPTSLQPSLTKLSLSQMATSTNTTLSSLTVPATATITSTLALSLVNNLGSSNAHVYISGLDQNGQVVMLTSNGEYYHPTSAASAVPQQVAADVAIPLALPGEVTQLILPDYLSSARVWFCVGTLSFSVVKTPNGAALVEPTTATSNDLDANVNWGFVELTFSAEYGLFANLSFVDFVGLPTGIELLQKSGRTQQALGMPSDAVAQLCLALQSKADEDGQPWDQLCVRNSDTSPLRVISPPTLLARNPHAFENYWNTSIDESWSAFIAEPLEIDTQSSSGQISCTSDGSTIACEGDSASYSKPNAPDIFGCNSGPFTILDSDNDIHRAVVPRLCAAIHRGTLKGRKGGVQPLVPPKDYYRRQPNNFYSAFVHEVELDGKGYAFPYDDVSPSVQDDTSGSVYAQDAEVLTIFVGGPGS